MIKRAYYSASISQFLRENQESILGKLTLNNSFDLNNLQRNAWLSQINILKRQLNNFDGRIMFEYTIPRMGKRVDVVVLTHNLIFLLEFKVGETSYSTSAYDQVYDYALDIKNFHQKSHDKVIVPIIVATYAQDFSNIIRKDEDSIIRPLRANKDNIASVIRQVISVTNMPAFDYEEWENSIYMPTPTIIEAAQALYANHNVLDIARSDSGAENLTNTTQQINKIIDFSRSCNKKSIIFVTGVPGAGKTLVGLNLASSRQDFQSQQRAVFLSGNGPLVDVLTEALARDKVEREKILGHKISKKEALRDTKSIIQIIHKYRDEYVGNNYLPSERIAIFDESQRAWTKEMISNFMRQKKNVPNFEYSEPEFLISTMDRFEDWAVIVCLVGGGQEINKGEAGLVEWFDSLRRSFSHWDIYVSDKIEGNEYLRESHKDNLFANLNIKTSTYLHLSTSMRSFRSEKLSEFIKAMLDINKAKAKELFATIKDKYPICLTRNLEKAKHWIKSKARGTESYGIIASSGALRLKPYGIFIKNELDPANWFLNDKSDIRSCYYLEDVASEFAVQGLELDYTIVAWDANFRFSNNCWSYHNFSGTKWQNLANADNCLYLKNAYRVLLTRARQGMIIFVPEGDDMDHTRQKVFYDTTFDYLKSLGLEIID